ncbi:hypothetical protein B0J11DRAFT_504245 [Dendryphion nanum]|uniref:Uncharacterized protein n=1 Tax=Dendryphion nanum TaxID=256645 RepID=A0A9P9E2Z7_9PLEO|nr:hypothetical protein B0J11DRAFT_504245 [Dendryphion nanum]
MNSRSLRAYECGVATNDGTISAEYLTQWIFKQEAIESLQRQRPYPSNGRIRSSAAQLKRTTFPSGLMCTADFESLSAFVCVDCRSKCFNTTRSPRSALYPGHLIHLNYRQPASSDWPTQKHLVRTSVAVYSALAEPPSTYRLKKEEFLHVLTAVRTDNCRDRLQLHSVKNALTIAKSYIAYSLLHYQAHILPDQKGDFIRNKSEYGRTDIRTPSSPAYSKGVTGRSNASYRQAASSTLDPNR